MNPHATEGTPEQIAWFKELCRKTNSPANAAKLMEARANINIVERLGEVRAPLVDIGRP
jgi:hypothetical protein